MITIQEITPYKGKLYRVLLSDERSLWLHLDLLCSEGLSKGDALTEEQITLLQQRAVERRTFEYALYLLERRAYSYRGLYDKLMQAQQAQEQATLLALEKLMRLGLLNDSVYAESLARQYVEQKRYGLRRAAMEMRQKGLSQEDIVNALEPYADPDDTVQRLAQLIERKYARKLTDPEDRKTIEQVKASLVRRGFDYADVRQAMDVYFSEE